jgi:xenotropic and polytropic retrovirus receptor 1
MKFEQFLNKEAVPEWRPKYLNYRLLKDHLRAIPLHQQNQQLESAFFSDCHLELSKISVFYSDKQTELQAKYNLFKDAFSKRDLINLYTEINFLKNFQLLNSTALKKILKKFVKVTGNLGDAQKFQRGFDDIWKDPKALDQLSRDIEELFTRKYMNSDRHRAMRRLRLRNFKNESFHSAAWFAGLLWGSILGILVYITSGYSQSDLFYYFTRQSIPFLSLALFSINSLVFKKSFVNYRFVFQFDKRNSLHECQFAFLTGLITFTFFTSWLIIFTLQTVNTASHLALLPLIISCSIFINPSPWPWKSARIWMLKTLFKIISAPISSVTFKDFFINDHLISQIYFFQGFLRVFGISPDSWSIKCIGIYPNLTRTLQCLRRFKETKIKLNLLNASKYSFSIVILIFRVTIKSGILLNILQACSTLFSLYWDLVMDFGLLQSTRNILLRDQLVVFPSRIFYYYIVLFNCTSRFSWILLDYKFLSHENIQLLIAIIEIFRRFHWTFLRIEYEHLNNCNMFKAVEDLKIPEIENRTADLFYKDMVSESRILENHENEELEVEEEEEEVEKVEEEDSKTNIKDENEDICIYYEEEHKMIRGSNV